jgi:hypothetical protein
MKKLALCFRDNFFLKKTTMSLPTRSLLALTKQQLAGWMIFTTECLTACAIRAVAGRELRLVVDMLIAPDSSMYKYPVYFDGRL